MPYLPPLTPLLGKLLLSPNDAPDRTTRIGQIARQPLAVRDQSRRTLDQRLALRFPRLGAGYQRLVDRLPPSSRLRQAVLWRGVRDAVEAFNRRDLDVSLLGYHRDFEFRPAPELVEAGLVDRCYHGATGYREYVSSLTEVWGPSLRVEPVELIDLWDRLVVLADLPVRGRASGVPLTEKFAGVYTLRDGRTVRQQDYLDHAQALEAVGLGEQGRPSPGF